VAVRRAFSRRSRGAYRPLKVGCRPAPCSSRPALRERDPNALRDDLRQGYVTAAVAERDYGASLGDDPAEKG
jgi:hypothetical protein